MMVAIAAHALPSNDEVASICSNISQREIAEYGQYGESVLIAETNPTGTPIKQGVGEWGRGFSGSITTTFFVRPLKFFKNNGGLPNAIFTAVDVEQYGADGGFQGGGLLPDSKAVSLIAITKSKSVPSGREVYASHRCADANNH